MGMVTAKGSVDNWLDQLTGFFNEIESAAKSGGWAASRSAKELEEDPFHLGARLSYEAPVLTLKRPDPQSGGEQKITFEPRFRYTIGAAGRIDVYSYPAFREAMLLRV